MSVCGTTDWIHWNCIYKPFPRPPMPVQSKTIKITRILNAPREAVWKAWTEPELMKKWWGPKDFTAPHIKNDLKVGGKYHYCMRGPAGSDWDKEMWSGGTYKEVIPMEKIGATDHFEDDKGNKISP